jgi:uncharacterized protein (UPF0264 family)
MKIIQIAVASDEQEGEVLYGLDDEGNLYEKANAFVAAGTEISPGHKTVRAAYGDFYWLRIEMPFTAPELSAEQLQRGF